jgi:uncharacterized protein with PQ loop repeat
MDLDLASIAGWVPAVVFPLATALQLAAILRRRSADGVSIGSWCLFAFANLSLYVYAGKYGELQSILAMLLTAALNIAIVVTAAWYRGPGRASGRRPQAPAPS